MEHPGEALIRLKGVKKSYIDHDFTALDGVDLEIKRKEYLVIMGRSGSGKSTMLHMLGCLDTPTEGSVYVDNVKTSALGQEELAKVRREKIGFVFQAFNLIPNLNVVQNVALPMFFAGMGKAERTKRAKCLLERVGLGSKVDNYPNELSGGEKQRVAIARALANNPEIILADEPTGNLDSTSAELVLDILDELHEKEGKTLVIVTHEKYVAERGERIIFMKDGKIDNIGKAAGKIK